MNILYTAFVRLPTEKAHGAQIVKMCEALSASGADVTLALPGRKTSIEETPFSFYGAEKNFKIKEFKVPDFISLGALGFIISALFFSEEVRWSKAFATADIIYSRDALVLLQYILLGKRIVYEAHTKPTFISTFVARRCYKVVAISKGLADAYRVRGVRNILIARDAVDLKAFAGAYNKEEVRKEFSLPQDKKIALYVGKIDEAKGADVFAAASGHTDVLCVLIGPGGDKYKSKYKKVVFLNETPYKDLPRVLSLADVLIIPNSGNDVNSSVYTSPLKAYAYMAARKPIVSSDVPALKEVFAGQDVEFFSAGDSSSCAAAIERALRKDVVSYKVCTWKARASDVLEHI